MYSISKRVSFVMFSGPYVEDLWRRRKSWPQFMQNVGFKEICASLIIKGNIRPHISYKARHTHTHGILVCSFMVKHHWYITFTHLIIYAHAFILSWQTLLIACSRTMSRKRHTCVTLCLFISELLILDLNMISYDSLLSPDHFCYSFIRFRVQTM